MFTLVYGVLAAAAGVLLIAALPRHISPPERRPEWIRLWHCGVNRPCCAR
jgi:hypothetical protein